MTTLRSHKEVCSMLSRGDVISFLRTRNKEAS